MPKNINNFFETIFFIFIFTLIHCKEKNTELKNERLTYKTTIDKDNSFYIINTSNEYQTITNLQKDELIINSGEYTYKWANQDSLTNIYFTSLLPKPDSKGYRDFSIYDEIFLKLYSPKATFSTFIIVIYCQEREPDEISSSTRHYIKYIIKIDFKGWKEFVIPLKSFDIGYSPDITKVTGVNLRSTGWGQNPNPKTVVYFDQICLCKMKYEFNIPEDEINIENYSNILKRLQYLLKLDLTDEDNPAVINKRLKLTINSTKVIQNQLNKTGLPFNFEITQTNQIYNIYKTKIYIMAIGYSIKGGELYKTS